MTRLSDLLLSPEFQDDPTRGPDHFHNRRRRRRAQWLNAEGSVLEEALLEAPLSGAVFDTEVRRRKKKKQRTTKPTTAPAPRCEPADHELSEIAFWLDSINKELARTPPRPTPLKLKKQLLESEINIFIKLLPDWIVQGCCEPALQTLESEVVALPWPADPDVQKLLSRLIQAIRSAQATAKKDFEHC